MQLRDIMTRDPLVLSPETTLKEAAQRRRDLDDRLPGEATEAVSEPAEPAR